MNLKLDIDTFNCSLSDLENTSTFRREGVSVAIDAVRINGEEVGISGLRDSLKIGKKLGSGSCSSVFISEQIGTGDKYAIKLFNIYDRDKRHQLIKEISILSNVQCDSLVNFYGAFNDQGSIGLILEYMDLGSLEFLMDPNIDLTEEALASIAFQILWGLAYLHYDSNLHRDIKPGI